MREHMANTEKEYVRLPGRGWRREGIVASTRSICSLWMGKDHLLCVDSSGYTEHYKRLYFADIQALVLRKTRSGAIVNAVFGGLAAMFVAFAVAVDDPVGRGFLGAFAGFFGLVLIINLAYGPTCSAHVQTAVQTQELPSLRRLRTARKALRRLKPAIEAAQGVYVPGMAAAAGMPEGTEAGAGISTPAVAMAPPAAPPAKHYHGNFHQALFVLLLCDAFNGVMHLTWSGRLFEAINGIVTAAEMICLIGALVRQSGSDLSPTVKRIVWGYLAFFAVMFVGAWIYGIYMAVQEKVSLSPQENPVLMVMIIISSLVGFGVGGAGLVALKRFRAEYAQSAAPPLPPPGTLPPG
jgi:uncharacterized RmlC-like cupin family protein